MLEMVEESAPIFWHLLLRSYPALCASQFSAQTVVCYTNTAIFIG